MKKILVLLLALMLVMSLAACAAADTADNDKDDEKVEDKENKEEEKTPDYETVEVGTKLSAPEVTLDEDSLCDFYFKLKFTETYGSGDGEETNEFEQIISVKGYNTDCIEYYEKNLYGTDYYKFDTVEKTVFCGYETDENTINEQPYAYESSYDDHWENTFVEMSTYTGIGVTEFLDSFGMSLVKCEDEDGCLVYSFDLGENAENTPMSVIKMYIDKNTGIATKLTRDITEGDYSSQMVCTVTEYSLTEHCTPDLEFVDHEDAFPEVPTGEVSTELVDNGDGTSTVYMYDEDGNLIDSFTIQSELGVEIPDEENDSEEN